MLNLFYISCPFVKQDYQIYPQYTQWYSLIENTKLMNFYSLEWFLKFTFAAIYGSMNLPLGVNLPQVKDHWNIPFDKAK